MDTDAIRCSGVQLRRSPDNTRVYILVLWVGTLDEDRVRISKERLIDSNIILEDEDVPDLIENIEGHRSGSSIVSMQFDHDSSTHEIRLTIVRDMDYPWFAEDSDNVEGTLRYVLRWSGLTIDDTHRLYARLKK